MRRDDPRARATTRATARATENRRGKIPFRNPRSFAIVRASPMTRASKNNLDRTIASRTHGKRYPTERTIETNRTNERTNERTTRFGRVDDEDECDKKSKETTDAGFVRSMRPTEAGDATRGRTSSSAVRKCQRCTFGHGHFHFHSDGRVPYVV